MGRGRRHSSWATGAHNQNRFRHRPQNDQVLVELTGDRPSGFLQKGFDVATSEAFDSPDRVTRQFAPADHPVDGHRRQLQQFGELSDSIEFRLGVVSQSRSWHGFPLSLCILINFRRYPLGIQRLCQAFPMLTIRILLTRSLGATVIY